MSALTCAFGSVVCWPRARPTIAVAFAFALLLGSGVVRAAAAGAADAGLSLASPFTDHAVIQQGRENLVWGTAAPGARLSIEFGELRGTVRASPDGEWRYVLPPLPPSFKPRSLVVADGRQRLRIDDILVGEVWFIAGQSNMEWRLNQSERTVDALDQSENPNVRYWVSRPRCAAEPRSTVDVAWIPEGWSTGWQPSGPRVAGRVSAVGFHFANELQRRLGRPVGIIQAAVGGTKIEAWTPRAAFSAPPFAADLEWLRSADLARKRELEAATEAQRLWVSRVARRRDSRNLEPPAWPGEPSAWYNRPTCFYNGMVHALTPYGLRGMLWYQGESNVEEGSFYFERLKAFIGAMRMVWESPQLPIGLLQLAPYLRSDPQGLPRVWEAQLKATRDANVGLVTISDLVTDVDNIHPANKHDVGRRAAAWALYSVYGQADILPTGPLYRSFESRDDGILVQFNYARGLSTMSGGAPNEFTIAGADRAFFPAQARILGSAVLVSSPLVPRPVAVRFGWHRVARPNLVNEARLPAASFRTDDWQDSEAAP